MEGRRSSVEGVGWRREEQVGGRVGQGGGREEDQGGGRDGHLYLERVVLLGAELADAEQPHLAALPRPRPGRQLARVAGGEHFGHLAGGSQVTDDR